MASERTPQQIIGDDAYTQLVFEGYVVTRPAPAATDTGLETVAWESMDNKSDPNDKLVYEIKFPRNGDKRLVYRSQADELLAAERAKTERWHKKAMDAGVIVHSDGTTSHPMRKELDDLKADNAALTAKKEMLAESLHIQIKGVNELEAKLAAVEKALMIADEALQADALASAHAAIRAALGRKPS